MRSSISNCNACFKGVFILRSLSTTSRANCTNRLSRELDTSSGFLKPDSYDVMIARASQAFWYVYIINYLID